MAEYTEKMRLLERLTYYYNCAAMDYTKKLSVCTAADCLSIVKKAPIADVVEVVRCRDCKFATELDEHCELNRAIYKHCSLLRGEPTNYVWHKYKRYYKNYSLVEADDYCSYGERKDGTKNEN